MSKAKNPQIEVDYLTGKKEKEKKKHEKQVLLNNVTWAVMQVLISAMKKAFGQPTEERTHTCLIQPAPQRPVWIWTQLWTLLSTHANWKDQL